MQLVLSDSKRACGLFAERPVYTVRKIYTSNSHRAQVTSIRRCIHCTATDCYRETTAVVYCVTIAAEPRVPGALLGYTCSSRPSPVSRRQRSFLLAARKFFMITECTTVGWRGINGPSRPIHYTDHARRQAGRPVQPTARRLLAHGPVVQRVDDVAKKLRRPSQCRPPALLPGQHAAGSFAGTCGPAVGRAVWMPPPLAGAAAARVPGPLTDGCIYRYPRPTHVAGHSSVHAHSFCCRGLHHHALGRLQKPSCVYKRTHGNSTA